MRLFQSSEVFRGSSSIATAAVVFYAAVPFLSASAETVRTRYGTADYVKHVPDSPFIHIGGDECPRDNWRKCPKCQARMKSEGLADENGLQGWIVSRMVRHLEKRGKRAAGWDEVLAGDVPKSTVGMVWRSSSKDGAGTVYVSAAEAIGRGHDPVLAAHDCNMVCYTPCKKEAS